MCSTFVCLIFLAINLVVSKCLIIISNYSKTATATGDPHYTTFDGKKYDFMGKCEYIFAKDCSSDHAFEVLQQNEPCGDGSVSCAKSIRILFNGIEIRMERNGVVYVDGVRVTFPWKQKGVYYISDPFKNIIRFEYAQE